ncbi:dienelactone hydrolase endo-1,3,1,4-beta-D-glucanase [Exidia glandulosa HHB12029]|uniref:Dienelactone hydrolase endo-1,3,1,4-beta-D-glucanase n=1 Tax=Exidia glandulosa HHB12029 TaxID=1314781 RepID=A0A165G0I5_EXIGL|nr:dienelactone hydrolase endo-1,3,1,4-beta-D-glucanase [Exidia glandulosa HHB12029]
MSFTKHCFEAVIHEGNPTGTVELINGVDVYIALPEGEYPKDKAVLFLTDVFGMQLVNNKLLADAFAKNGFQVYLPDYLNGDPYPADYGNGSGFDREAWRARHTQAATRNLLDKAIAGLKERGITTFAATGYCFGGRYSVDLAQDNVVSVISVAHPSRYDIPKDFELLMTQSKAAFQIHSCEVDPAFPAEACAAADEIFGGGKYAPGYERRHWMGCQHGFAVRGDLSDPQVRAGKEGAFKGAVEWFQKYL